jgi:phospholipase/carboxylesterase
MTEQPLSFIHRFLPAQDVAQAKTLVLLHGTGGDENDLLELGQQLDPAANILSPRGKVLENGMPRFFRRFAEGVFDIEDLKLRTQELADFIQEAAKAYAFDHQCIIVVGYSNGANIAASLLLLRPEVLRGAILMRATLPFEPVVLPVLQGKAVLILGGTEDHMIPQAGTERLAEVLQRAGAVTTLQWQQTGHGLLNEDIRAAQAFVRA